MSCRPSLWLLRSSSTSLLPAGPREPALHQALSFPCCQFYTLFRLISSVPVFTVKFQVQILLSNKFAECDIISLFQVDWGIIRTVGWVFSSRYVRSPHYSILGVAGPGRLRSDRGSFLLWGRVKTHHVIGGHSCKLGRIGVGILFSIEVSRFIRSVFLSFSISQMEMTNDIQFLLPIMVTIMVAKWIGDLLTHSFYHALLEVWTGA